MKRTWIVSLCVLAVNVASAQEEKLNLRKCIETGIANNLEVKQTGLQAERDAIVLKQSKVSRFPDLNASGSNGINQGRSIDPFTNTYSTQQITYAGYGAGSSLLLFNGFSLSNTIKQNEFYYQASKMDLQQAKDNLTIDIILSYLLVLNNEDLLQLSRNQAALSVKQVDRLEIMNKEGAIPPSQLFDLKGQFANDQLQIINTKNALDNAKIALCRLMNTPYNETMQLERIDTSSYAMGYAMRPDSIYAIALKEFAQVKAVDLRKQGVAKSVRVAKGNLFPTLSFGANVNTNYSSVARNDVFLGTSDVISNDYVIVSGSPTNVVRKQNNFSSEKIGYGRQLNNNIFSSFSLNLRVPIFNALQGRNRIKLVKLELKNSELVAGTTKTRLQQQIESAYVNMTSASERYSTILDQVAAYAESFRAADIRFNSGVGNSIDYLIAKNNLDRANMNLVNARYDYILRTRVLDFYQAKPLF